MEWQMITLTFDFVLFSASTA